MKTVRCSGNIGDCIFSLPCCIAIGNIITYYLQTNITQKYYMDENNPHPCGNYRMTEDFAKKLIPLLESQPYIKKANIWNDENIDYDLDRFREMTATTDIPNCFLSIFNKTYNLNKPWLKIIPDLIFKDKIVINRTKRYLNTSINYSFLKKYKDIIVFTGLKDEYEDFKIHNFACDYYFATDFLALAKVLAGAKAFIGNQSFAFTLAEGLKIPRLLEICLFAKTTKTYGGYECLDQKEFMTYAEILIHNKNTFKNNKIVYCTPKIFL